MKQESMKVLFFIRKSKLLKNGEAPISLRVTVNGQLTNIHNYIADYQCKI
jgi:hypothetical protein